MSLRDDIQSDFDDILLNAEEFAELIDYAPADGDAVEGVPALIVRDNIAAEFEVEGEWELLTGTARISKSDVSSCRRGDRLTDQNSVEWMVVKVLIDNAAFAKVEIETKIRKTAAGIKKR